MSLGIQSSAYILAAILSHVARPGASLVVFDNFETPWKLQTSREEVEGFLARLSELPNLFLVVTMRGAERPGKYNEHVLFYQLSAHFLHLRHVKPSLTSRMSRPLTRSLLQPNFWHWPATFRWPSICWREQSHMKDILQHSRWRRWRVEQTALLSDGPDKRSNLEQSIMVSPSGPRCTPFPEAKALLGLLALLPDEVSDEDLVASNIPIPNIRQHRSILIRTSLAYIDYDQRAEVLCPIREYIQTALPPNPSFTHSLRLRFTTSLYLRDSSPDPGGTLPALQHLIIDYGSVIRTMDLDGHEDGVEVGPDYHWDAPKIVNAVLHDTRFSYSCAYRLTESSLRELISAESVPNVMVCTASPLRYEAEEPGRGGTTDDEDLYAHAPGCGHLAYPPEQRPTTELWPAQREESRVMQRLAGRPWY
ncbi:hypothetical protein DFH09DRAFT_1322123 [Mycena vulgaris]|nr:hypothetical protein DFH09DRAFT_1322123 [Mycena vulgaris]